MAQVDRRQTDTEGMFNHWGSHIRTVGAEGAHFWCAQLKKIPLCRSYQHLLPWTEKQKAKQQTKNQLGELTVSFMEIMQVKNNYDCSFSIVDMYGGRSKRKKYCLNKTHLREP